MVLPLPKQSLRFDPGWGGSAFKAKGSILGCWPGTFISAGLKATIQWLGGIRNTMDSFDGNRAKAVVPTGIRE